MKDVKTYHTIQFSLKVIGEAIDKTPYSYKSAHSDIMWDGLRWMRNDIAHEYFRGDPEDIFNTMTQYIPKLKIKVEKLIKELQL